MTRTFTALAIALAATLATAAAMPAHAAIAVYDFENTAIGTETPFTLVAGGLSATFAGPAGVDPGAFGISSNFRTPSGFQYRTMQGDFLTIGSAFGASGSPLTIRFSAPVSAFSLAFALDDPANGSLFGFTTSSGGTASSSGFLTSGFRYPEGTLSYAGDAFTSITFSSTAIDFQVDNLQATFAPVAAVPEPESLLMLLAGLPALVLARRRARRSAPAEAPTASVA